MIIEGTVALVTGGARGLGLSIATHLQRRGAEVVVVDVDQEALACMPENIESHVLDVTNPAEARAVSGKIANEHERIDILVNNAGAIYSEPMVNIMNPGDIMHDYDRFRRIITLNMDSVFIMTSAVVQQMIMKRTKGCIVNISSISAEGNEGQTAYSAAKSGVNAMTVTWAKELGRFGIRCNAVAPGFIDTPSTRSALNEHIIKYIVNNTPLRRLGEPEEVAKAVACIIENNFMNGVILDINGGLTI